MSLGSKNQIYQFQNFQSNELEAFTNHKKNLKLKLISNEFFKPFPKNKTWNTHSFNSAVFLKGI